MKRIAGLYVAWLVAAGLLIFAAVERHPYSYYTLLRWICCPVFAYSAFAAHEKSRVLWVWIFGVLAGLYNPILRVHLDRSTWIGVNWFTVAVIVVAAIAFWRPATEPTESNQQWLEGYNAFKRGQELYFQNELQQALPCLDTAIDSGFEGADEYSMRGGCLQSLEFHLDAIDDFSKAIGFESDDSNFYFMRSISKGAVGDLQGRVADLNEAIRVAGIDNAANGSHNAWAKEQGYKNGIAGMYQMNLLLANLDIERQASDDRRLQGPGVSLFPDLVTERRSLARRRTRQ